MPSKRRLDFFRTMLPGLKYKVFVEQFHCQVSRDYSFPCFNRSTKKAIQHDSVSILIDKCYASSKKNCANKSKTPDEGNLILCSCVVIMDVCIYRSDIVAGSVETAFQSVLWV